MIFNKFNIEYVKNCKSKDYLYVGSVSRSYQIKWSSLWSPDCQVQLPLPLRLQHALRLQAHLQEEVDDPEVQVEQERPEGWIQCSDYR